MKRSRDEHIIQGFPNEIVLYHVMVTDVKVMMLLAQTCKRIQRCMDEQQNLYFNLFKYNFKNEYCLLYDLLVNEQDVTTIFDELHRCCRGDTFSKLALSFSCTPDEKFRENYPIDASFILNAPFSRLIQYYHPYAGTFKDDYTEELYEELCSPWNPFIIEQCQRDMKFASKMARLFNTTIHPCGYPNASYYMTYQSDVRRLVCRMFRILDKCITECDSSDESNTTFDDALILREELVEFISAEHHEEMAAKLMWSDKSEEESWKKENEADEDDDCVMCRDSNARTPSFIGLLDALAEEEFPKRKDACHLYKWWQENAVPYLKKTPPLNCEWVIEEDPAWHIEEDTMYFDVLDESAYKKRILSVFFFSDSITDDSELELTLESCKNEYNNDKDISRLEQHAFRILLYRLLKYPLRPCGYIRGSNPHLTDRS